MFSHPIRIYWEDTDAGGVVYHAQYLCFLERTRTEWLRARGVGQHGTREEHDLVMAVRSMQLEFEKPARLDDVVDSRLWLRERRGASFTLVQELWRDGDCLLRASVKVACLRAGAFRPRALPPWLVEAIGEPMEKIDGDAAR